MAWPDRACRQPCLAQDHGIRKRRRGVARVVAPVPIRSSFGVASPVYTHLSNRSPKSAIMRSWMIAPGRVRSVPAVSLLTCKRHKRIACAKASSGG
jgi:hypothetical protein